MMNPFRFYPATPQGNGRWPRRPKASSHHRIYEHLRGFPQTEPGLQNK